MFFFSFFFHSRELSVLCRSRLAVSPRDVAVVGAPPLRCMLGVSRRVDQGRLPRSRLASCLVFQRPYVVARGTFCRAMYVIASLTGFRGKVVCVRITFEIAASERNYFGCQGRSKDECCLFPCLTDAFTATLHLIAD